MNTYKIQSLTSDLPKRNVLRNKTLEITYVDNMIKKTLKIKPNEVVYFTSNELPLSLKKLLLKKLILISEVELSNIKNTKKQEKKTIVKDIKTEKKKSKRTYKTKAQEK